MSKKYKNPPIKEAVCEVRFPADKPLAAEKIEQFYEQIKDNFPNRKIGKVGSFQLNLSKDKEGEAKLQEQKFDIFLSEDQKTAVHIFSEGTVSVHRFEPYSSWTELKPVLFEVVDAYRKIFSPGSVERIGLRFVNEIKFEKDGFSTDKYFLYELKFPDEVEGEVISHFVGTLFKVEDGRDAINVRIADKATKEDNERAFTFDLDYFLSKPQGILPDKLHEWIENAHKKLESYFEAILSGETKKMFDQ